MSNSIYNIIPGVGINKIIFGMDQEQVIEKMGMPEKEINPDEEGDIVYIYDKLGAFYFASEYNFRFTSMEIDVSQKISISGINLFKQNRDAILHIFSDQELEIHEMKDEEGIFETSFNFPNISLTVHLNEYDEVESISVGVIFDNNDEVIWPGLTY